jgi:hypothetical protein
VTPVDGAILVWGAVTPDGRDDVIGHHGFADVLALEDMLADLHSWQDAAWAARVDEIAGWATGLLDAMR